MFGQNKFEGILIGPSSTGWVWRREASKVSITPEEFDARNGGAVLGKGKPPISCKASLEATGGEAEGLALKEKAMEPNVLRAKAFENMRNHAKVYLPTGKDAEGSMPVLGMPHLDREPAK